MILRDLLNPGIQYRIPNGAHLSDVQIQQMIADKAKEYGVSVDFRPDFVANNPLEGMLKLLTAECTVLYDPQTNVKKPNPGYIMVIQREGTYLFITFKEHSFSSHSNWSAIMGDVFAELFGN